MGKDILTQVPEVGTKQVRKLSIENTAPSKKKSLKDRMKVLEMSKGFGNFGKRKPTKAVKKVESPSVTQTNDFESKIMSRATVRKGRRRRRRKPVKPVSTPEVVTQKPEKAEELSIDDIPAPELPFQPQAGYYQTTVPTNISGLTLNISPEVRQ